jgi:hypothetical protein
LEDLFVTSPVEKESDTKNDQGKDKKDVRGSVHEGLPLEESKN